MKNTTPLNENTLKINPEEEVDKIVSAIKSILRGHLKRKGIVVGLSGGIDSSTSLAVAVKALGPERVFGLLMPEHHSDSETLRISNHVADTFHVATTHENISSILEAVGFYDKYNAAVRTVIPEYDNNWKSKIVIPNILETRQFSLFTIVAQAPDGSQIQKRLPLKAYLEILAATNFKQRTRKMLEYYHADRLHYAVAGTPNRLEYDQGFFVKLGDGAADIKPIAHLYKSQVYQIAEYLGVPEEVCRRPPTTDTYSLPQGQDEFYFSLPYEKMDLCLFALNHGIKSSDVASHLHLTTEQVERVFKDIQTKRSTTKYLHLPAILIEQVPEIVLG